jgi:transcriptional regulator with XRE-family HTH domain
VRSRYERALAREQDKLGQRLHELRVAAGLTQQEAAQVVGMSERQIRRLEHGLPNVMFGTLLALAMAYGVGVRDLFPDER